MKCHELAERIEKMQPQLPVHDVARLCLLLGNSVDNVDALEDPAVFTTAWQSMGLRLQAATDQHAAMTEELENLAKSDPQSLSPEQVWVLVRAVRVQGQVLQLYLGQQASRLADRIACRLGRTSFPLVSFFSTRDARPASFDLAETLASTKFPGRRRSNSAAKPGQSKNR